MALTLGDLLSDPQADVLQRIAAHAPQRLTDFLRLQHTDDGRLTEIDP
jgi:hypothetical protein